MVLEVVGPKHVWNVLPYFAIWRAYFPPGWLNHNQGWVWYCILHITWDIIADCLCKHFLSFYSIFRFGCSLIRKGLCCFNKCLWDSYFPGNLCKHSWLEGLFFLDTCRWDWAEFPLLCYQSVIIWYVRISIHPSCESDNTSHTFWKTSPLRVHHKTYAAVIQHSKPQNPRFADAFPLRKPGCFPARKIYLSLRPGRWWILIHQ